MTNGIQGGFRGLGDLKITLNSSMLNMGFRVAAAAVPVSYTHLDVYKRQVHVSAVFAADYAGHAGFSHRAFPDSNSGHPVFHLAGQAHLLSLIHI